MENQKQSILSIVSILYFGILAFCVFRISFAFWSTIIFCAWM